MEWSNRNSGRNYPIDSDGAVVSSLGFVLPLNLIVDAFIVHGGDPDVAPEIHSINISRNIVTVFIRQHPFLQKPSDTTIWMASAVLGKPGRSPITKTMEPLSPEISGWIEFGDYMEQPWSGTDQGMHYFNFGVARFCPRAFLAVGLPPVLSISETFADKSLSGDVKFSSSGYLVNTPIIFTDADGVESLGIIFSLSDPSQFLSPCSGGNDSGECASYPLRSINGVLPDENGNITIQMPGMAIIKNLITGSVLKDSKALCTRPDVYNEKGDLTPGPGVYWDKIEEPEEEPKEEPQG
jgi:hypothetical protein